MPPAKHPPARRKTPPKGSAVPPRRAASGSARFLYLAIGASVLVHAAVLSLHFRFPEKSARRTDTGLEVVLVNARHARRPDKAEALAQANLDGGGNQNAKHMPTSPLPPQDQSKDGDALVEARRRVQQLEAQQARLLEQVKSETHVASSPEQKDKSDAPPTVTGLDLVDRAAAIARLEAKVDRDLDAYAKRPRMRFIGARTREYRFSQYVEAWRHKIERIGTLNYPAAARGKTYGSLVLSVQIRADGSVAKVEIQQSSGHKVLDDAALRIVRLAAPFAPFPPNIRKDTDMIEIIRHWNFTSSDLQTN